MSLDRDFVDVWAYPICCTAGMPGDTLSRDAFQEEQNTTYHFAPWMFGEGRLKKGSVEDIQERPAEKKHSS